MLKEIYRKNKGFCPESEVKFLSRLKPDTRIANLDLELSTQLAEDFGMVKYTKEYEWQNGYIVDMVSGESISELTSKGNVFEETEAMLKIETGLRQNPNETWVHFSPKNENLGYTENCIDFWRCEDDKVVWNRIQVVDGFGEMKKVLKVLGGVETKDEMDILANPINSNLKLNELFSFFDMASEKYDLSYELINEKVKSNLEEFKNEFGEEIVLDKEKIFRLYSSVYDYLRKQTEGGKRYVQSENLDFDYNLSKYMFGIMSGSRQESSFGCAGATTVGEFGYYIMDGRVSYGKIPEGFKVCKKCGCWYTGSKCILCD